MSLGPERAALPTPWDRKRLYSLFEFEKLVHKEGLRGRQSLLVECKMLFKTKNPIARRIAKLQMMEAHAASKLDLTLFFI